MFVTASTRCFADVDFGEACHQITDLGFDKVELWFDQHSATALNPEEVAADPEQFFALYREKTRLTPVAFHLQHDVSDSTFAGLSKTAKLMRVAQITVPPSPLGTPFNTEIDRLRSLVSTANHDGVRVSIKTLAEHVTADPHTAVELCQAVKGLGLTLDPSYFIVGHSEPLTYDQVYPYVFHVHLRDTSAKEVQVPVGLGAIEYGTLILHLQRTEYSRALSVDLIPGKTKGDERLLEMRKLRMLLESHL